MSQVPDPDDIFREIDETNFEQRKAELDRLAYKLRTLKGHHTTAYNILDNLIKATRGANNTFDASTGNQNAIERAREKLELRFEKLERCHNRMLSISRYIETADGGSFPDMIEEKFNEIQEKYSSIIAARGQLMIDMLPRQAPQSQAGGAHQNLKPIEALKPSFTLDFENSPTELAAWMAQFKAYYEASRLHVLPVQQQQAFLRQGVQPDVWIAIQQKINLTTNIFKNALDLDGESCEKYIEDAFQIRYPLIMRRYRFFTYQRKGNQTFTNFYGKLIELANAAQLENMGQKEYLMFRIIAGINDPVSVDKLLSIPQADFNLEEVHRVAVACEAAKNYTGLNDKTSNHSFKMTGKKPFNQPTKDPGKDQDNQNEDIDHRSLTGAAKIKFLREHGKCVRCGYDMHPKDTPCPHKTTTCHKCKAVGHISPVCARE